MRTYTIAPIARATLAGLGSAYVGTFGVLWLFVEPLGAFGMLPSFSVLSGTAIYGLLLLVPALVLPGLLRWYRWFKTHRLPFIGLNIRSAADGATYSLRVAENMQVGELLRQYVAILLRGPAKEQVEATRRRYYPVLQVRRDGAFVDVDSNLSVHAAGLRNNDECQVRAQECEHFNQVMFSRGRASREQNDAEC